MGAVAEIEARGIHYRDLNEMVRRAVSQGAREVRLKGVNGQYYIGAGLSGQVEIYIDGVPGNDLGAFMDGPTIIVNGNAQDTVGNTMNSGKIVVHGHAGDVLGYGMRGGRLFIKEDVGYRVGIHMKGYDSDRPAIVVGGRAGDFFGEYMAGGILVLLGLNRRDTERPLTGDYLGTGMHGGTIYVRGEVDGKQCGREVGVSAIDPRQEPVLMTLIDEFCRQFGLEADRISSQPFSRVVPVSSRPYGKLYTY